MSKIQYRKFIPLVFLSGILAASVATAGQFFDRWHHGGKGMFTPIERMVDHIDLNEVQEQQVEEIINNARENSGDIHKIKYDIIKNVINNKPQTNHYFETAEQQAELMSTVLKDKFMTMAKVRHDIYEVLTIEQKEQLEKHMNKFLRRMAKK